VGRFEFGKALFEFLCDVRHVRWAEVVALLRVVGVLEGVLLTAAQF
jgi:hypothetical protein